MRNKKTPEGLPTMPLIEGRSARESQMWSELGERLGFATKIARDCFWQRAVNVKIALRSIGKHLTRAKNLHARLTRKRKGVQR